MREWDVRVPDIQDGDEADQAPGSASAAVDAALGKYIFKGEYWVPAEHQDDECPSVHATARQQLLRAQQTIQQCRGPVEPPYVVLGAAPGLRQIRSGVDRAH